MLGRRHAHTTAKTHPPRRGLFGGRKDRTTRTSTKTTTTGHRRHGLLGRRAANPDRRAAGLKASLANPNTTHKGRQQAKAELRAMGRSDHVPLSVKVKRTLGIRSTPHRRHARRI